MFVLDASVAIAWVVGDERLPQAEAAAVRLEGERAVVPSLWISEVANGLLVAERRRRIPTGAAERAIALLERLPIEVVPETWEALPRIHGLGSELGLTAYDATYLDLALEAGFPLATLDEDLRRAARTKRVPLLIPGSK